LGNGDHVRFPHQTGPPPVWGNGRWRGKEKPTPSRPFATANPVLPLVVIGWVSSVKSVGRIEPFRRGLVVFTSCAGPIITRRAIVTG
jgi:hypothetical protein